MTDFKQGDRVRLKLKPEIEMTLREKTYTGRWAGHTDRDVDGHYDAYHRWPEELELVPRSLQAGDRMRHVGSDIVGEVKAVYEHKGQMWVTICWDDLSVPHHYRTGDDADGAVVRA